MIPNEQGQIARSGHLTRLLDEPGPERQSRALKENYFWPLPRCAMLRAPGCFQAR